MEDSPWSNFGEWLQRTRRRQGLSQASLADLLGFTPNYIWRLEKGKRHPSTAFLRLLRHEMPLTAAEAAQLNKFFQIAQYNYTGFAHEREREISRSLAEI
jgi:transcriptional regulator with XRE-family HTH domain